MIGNSISRKEAQHITHNYYTLGMQCLWEGGNWNGQDIQRLVRIYVDTYVYKPPQWVTIIPCLYTYYYHTKPQVLHVWALNTSHFETPGYST